jgi:chromosome partitioning protein
MLKPRPRIAVRAAGLVVVPVQPSPLDLWATTETLKIARDEQRRSLVVLNRVPPRSSLTDEIVAQLGRIGSPIAATRIGNRVALARAMALGLGVVETVNAAPAAAEITALAEEVRAVFRADDAQRQSWRLASATPRGQSFELG